MPRIPFQKPKKIEWEILTDRYGRLVAEPFEKGYALTVGQLAAPHAAVHRAGRGGGVGADHGRAGRRRPQIPGVQESTADVLLNLKKLAVEVPSGEPTRDRGSRLRGPKEVTGADVSEATGVEVLNPEIHIATLEAGAALVDRARGRRRAAATRRPTGIPRRPSPPGAIAAGRRLLADPRAWPTTSRMSRLGKITDYEKLILEIWTNGAVSPDDALDAGRHATCGTTSPRWRPKGATRRTRRWRRRGEASCRRASPSRSRSWRCPRGPSTR